MRKLAVIGLCAALAAAALAAARSEGAVSADPNAAKIAALQRQVKALQRQVTTLQTASRNLNGQIVANFAGDTCLGAQLSDLIQGTWGVIDQIAQTAQQRSYFGPQTQVDDFGNCADLINPSVPRPGIRVPPTIEPMGPLMQWLHVEFSRRVVSSAKDSAHVGGSRGGLSRRLVQD